MQETHLGQDVNSVGYPPQNNVCGLYDSNQQRFRSYDSIEEALTDCRRVLVEHYQRLSISQIAPIWAPDGTAETWIENVTWYYYE